MKRCRNCGTVVLDETELCPYCSSVIFTKISEENANIVKYNQTIPRQGLEKPAKKHGLGKIFLFLFLGFILYSCVNSYRGGPFGKQVKSYEDIYDEYAQKLRDATPKLIQEYYSESKTNTSGIMGLATISNNKILELAEISNEGVMEMANHMYAIHGEYSEYEEWSGKLYSVYMEESAKISSAYMKSAMGAFGY